VFLWDVGVVATARRGGGGGGGGGACLNKSVKCATDLFTYTDAIMLEDLHSPSPALWMRDIWTVTKTPE